MPNLDHKTIDMSMGRLQIQLKRKDPAPNYQSIANGSWQIDFRREQTPHNIPCKIYGHSSWDRQRILFVRWCGKDFNIKQSKNITKEELHEIETHGTNPKDAWQFSK